MARSEATQSRPEGRRAGRVTLKLRNFRRSTFYKARKNPTCMECGIDREWIGLIPGDSRRGSLADENMKTGICSWTCFLRFYRIIDGDQALCRCGSPVLVPGARCLPCQHRSTDAVRITENASTVYRNMKNMERDNGLSTSRGVSGPVRP
jgi:hypothetical protein